MRRVRTFALLLAASATVACQTVTAAGNGLATTDRVSAVTAASAPPIAPSNSAARAGISRPAARSDADASASNFARASSRNILLVVAVVAVIVIGIALMSGDDGGGIY
jgi:hypothetical protein